MDTRKSATLSAVIFLLLMPSTAWGNSAGLGHTGGLPAGRWGVFAADGSFRLLANPDVEGQLFQGVFSRPRPWKPRWATDSKRPRAHHGALGHGAGAFSNGQLLSFWMAQSSLEGASSRQFSSHPPFMDGVANVPVPEPGSMGLLATGILGLAFLLRRKFSSPVAGVTVSPQKKQAQSIPLPLDMRNRKELGAQAQG